MDPSKARGPGRWRTVVRLSRERRWMVASRGEGPGLLGLGLDFGLGAAGMCSGLGRG